ncbi:hypothetical protein ACIO8F_08140 [Streptomyces sp. NPDC087228]|uniref:hypothetical protein n=1 Tax=Streptomyces sp. NPDC087228 TaxID=3365772 RepID=UPI00380E6B9E
MMRPGLTADGHAVRLPIADQITAPLLDALAVAYIDDADVIGQLLTAHGLAVLAHDHAVCSDDTPDYVRATRVAEKDSTREALLDELPPEHQADPQLSPDAAITLAGRLTHLAGHIRHTRKATP